MSDSAGSNRFPETHWSQVFNVGNPADPRHREHLNTLLRQYWKPAYHYIRAMRRLTAHDAEDTTQAFFAMLLERVDFSTLSPERGSFRGFLKIALRRFVISEDRKKAARVSTSEGIVDVEKAESLGAIEVLTPDEAFDRQWARAVLNEMLARLQKDLADDGKTLYWQLFKAYRLDDAEEEITYQKLADDHGIKEDDVRNHLRFVRKRARDLTRAVISEYLLPGEDLEDELRFVWSQ